MIYAVFTYHSYDGNGGIHDCVAVESDLGKAIERAKGLEKAAKHGDENGHVARLVSGEKPEIVYAWGNAEGMIQTCGG